ncbi:carboxypeptidase [Thermoleophilia bacterium SCSIO 60948]|nr:carboxypeptidase [Thermoleophilia bacterium SCSIO 60948]
MKVVALRRGGRIRFALAVSAGLVATTGSIAVGFAAPPAEQGGLGSSQRGAECPTQPTFDSSITSPEEAIPGYPNQVASTDELLAYVERLDSETDRVSAATYGESVAGQPLVYALAGDPADVADPEAVAERQQRLRLGAGSTDQAEATELAESSPAIAWYAGNVHGNEPSGGDAAIQLLYEIAAREDCAAIEIRDELLTGVIPTQNPDGRDDERRENDNGFDLNRDWFARTQPETAAKIDLLRELPPVLFVDAHEMGGRQFFFPPNADPIHHEISPQAVGWINDLYGGANSEAFEARQEPGSESFDFFNYDIYDLLYMGYGDTVPTTAFGAAGMTYEKGGDDTNRQRWLEQRVAGWTTLRTAAQNKRSILMGLWREHRTALAEGRAGKLEPNRVYQPDAEVERQVPDLTIRNYFFSPSNFPEASELVDRLRDFDVEVRRLTAPVQVPGLRRYGRGPRTTRLPAGTYWVPMNQVQKRWVQAILGQDSYVPFPYFYDVTAWSNPLLMNLDAWFTGARVDPEAEPVDAGPQGGLAGDPEASDFAVIDGRSPSQVAAAMRLARDGADVERVGKSSGGIGRGDFAIDLDGVDATQLEDAATDFRTKIRFASGPAPAGKPVGTPSVALYASTQESARQLRFSLRGTWEIPFDVLTGGQVDAGALANGDYDVFVVPGVGTGTLDTAGDEIRDWVNAGGRYIGTGGSGSAGGTAYAIAKRLTTARASRPEELVVPGSMFRVAVSPKSALTLGAPRFAYEFNLGEDVLRPGSASASALRFPRSRSDFFTSGYAEGQSVLRGTSALIDERFGEGEVVLFSGEPNFRAYTEGMSLFLLNAIARPGGAPAAAPDAASARYAAERRTAAASLPEAIGPGRPLRVEVAADDADRASAVLESLGASGIRTALAGDTASLTIPNPSGLDPAEHPFARQIVPALEAAGVPVISAVL